MTKTLKVKRFGDGVGKPKKIEPGISWTRRMMDEELPDLPEFESATAESTEVSDKSDQGEDVNEDPDDVVASEEPCDLEEEYSVGTFVVAMYEEEWFIGQVERERDGLVLVKYMKHSGGHIKNSFMWPGKSDMLKTNVDDIVCKVDPPIPISSRAHGLNLKDMKIFDKKLVKWFNFFILLYLYLNLYLLSISLYISKEKFQLILY